MRVQCPYCGAGGNILDDKVPPTGTKIVCPKCKSSFFIQPQKTKEDKGQDAVIHYQEGVKLLKEHHIDAAIEKFNRAIQVNPQYSEAYRYLGLAYGQKKLWEEASQNLQKAVTYQPDDLQSLKNLGVAYLQQKKFTEAIQALEKLLQKTPEDEKAKSYLMMAVEGHQQQQAIAESQKPATSAETLEESASDIEIPPSQEKLPPKRNPVQELLDKGAEYLNNAQYNQAIEAFQEICRIDPNNSNGYFGLGMVYEKRKDVAKAVEAYQKVLELNPNDNLAKENLKFLKKQGKKFQLPWKK
jgi:protein O-GlcNAc transferase